MVTTSAATRSAERDLIITRVFDAPRGRVFAAWTERDHLVRWSAPHGFTITHCEGDLRPSGAWRCCMRAPDGIEHWLGGVYREIIAPERLVFTHAWDDEQARNGHETLVTVTFADQVAGTRLTLHQAGFESAAARDSHQEGWTECLDRLAEHLGPA